MNMELIQYDNSGINIELGRYSDEFSIWHVIDPDLYPMKKPHRHYSVEINLVRVGDLAYHTPRGLVTIPRHRLAVFWAAIPHQSVVRSDQIDFFSVHLPLSLVLRWKLDGQIFQSIMDGNILVDSSAELYEADAVYFQTWYDEYVQSEPYSAMLAFMELQCRVERSSSHLRSLPVAPVDDSIRRCAAQPDLVSQMADYIHLHYQEPISIADVAEHVDLHPKSAIRAFQRKCGIAPKHYLSMLRIYHAQLLLTTTSMRVRDVAAESGFQTVGAFHVAFRKACGCPPQAYRYA